MSRIIKWVLLVPVLLFGGLFFNGYFICPEPFNFNVVGTCNPTAENEGKVYEFQTDSDNLGWWTTWLLFKLMDLIVEVVGRSVKGYFIAFIVCWNATGEWLVTMIDNYFKLLVYLIDQLTAWPMNLFGTICLAISLFFVYKVLSLPCTFAAKRKRCKKFP